MQIWGREWLEHRFEEGGGRHELGGDEIIKDPASPISWRRVDFVHCTMDIHCIGLHSYTTAGDCVIILEGVRGLQDRESVRGSQLRDRERRGEYIHEISGKSRYTHHVTFITSIFLVGHCSKCFIHFSSI